MTLQVVCDTRDQLGEGLCWSASESRIYWFDILGRRLRWLGPEGPGELALPFRASAAAPRARGGLLMATDAGLAVFDPATLSTDLIRPMTLTPGFRTNDGKVDPQGRFWWSTMDDDGGARPGAVHVTGPDLSTSRVVEGIHIANATAFSPDGVTLYLADSKLQTIFTYDTADLRHRRTFARTQGQAEPDGAALDAEGGLWVAEWGGWRVVRYTPDGTIDRIVEAPVAQPTCCAFGGPDLATLYVTSAWAGLSDTARVEQPLAGALFAFEPGVTGQPIPAFAG